MSNNFLMRIGNNMYVFPGIGLGAILSKAVNVTQDMIYASGESLSETLTPEESAVKALYPDIRRIRDVSIVVTRGVIRAAQKNGVDRELAMRNLSDDQLDEYIRQRMYDPFRERALLKAEVRELGMRTKSDLNIHAHGGVADAVNGVRAAVASAAHL
jgi:malate dehydrogenase (oxaloacetate-decarboxylating)(NADP+)